MSKSRPLYAPIRFDATGRRHLIVTDGPAVPEAALAEGMTAAMFDERWTIAGHSLAIPSPDTARVRDHEYRSVSHLLIALRRRLTEERMGFRLYAVGVEGFLWDVRTAASGVGMRQDEVQLSHTGSRARRVFCNHCRTITENVTTNIVLCTGCGAHLAVREHFSRRLNAFAGFQIDAEVPGEIPEIEEIFK
jgi:hypothetical protein